MAEIQVSSWIIHLGNVQGSIQLRIEDDGFSLTNKFTPEELDTLGKALIAYAGVTK